jgi:hypothetical protein
MNAATPPSSADPNAPLPPDASPQVRAFYDTVNKLIDEIHASDFDAGEALIGIWGWMTTHVPERLLRPKASS